MIKLLPMLFVLASILVGCPPPQPLTGAQCATDETRKNCGLCASDPACAWCASEVPAQVGCRDRSRTIDCAGPVIRLLEACEGPEERLVLEP